MILPPEAVVTLIIMAAGVIYLIERCHNQEEDDEMDTEHSVDDADLFAGKRACLQSAIDIRKPDDTPEQIISVAQKFWDFLRADDPEVEDD